MDKQAEIARESPIKAHEGPCHLRPHYVIAALDPHVNQNFFLCLLVTWNKKLKMPREKM